MQRQRELLTWNMRQESKEANLAALILHRMNEAVHRTVLKYKSGWPDWKSADQPAPLDGSDGGSHTPYYGVRNSDDSDAKSERAIGIAFHQLTSYRDVDGRDLPEDE
jgi:hypothetical protein